MLETEIMITQAELTSLNRFKAVEYGVVLDSEIEGDKLTWYVYIDQGGTLEPLFSRSGDRRMFKSLDTLISHVQEHCTNARSIKLIIKGMPYLSEIDVHTQLQKE